MTLSNLNVALVQIATVLAADTKSRDAARGLNDAEADFWAGRVAGLAQALTILAVVGEQPVASAKYLAGIDHDVREDALAHLPDLQ
jgi:hypothetical protein